MNIITRLVRSHPKLRIHLLLLAILFCPIANSQELPEELFIWVKTVACSISPLPPASCELMDPESAKGFLRTYNSQLAITYCGSSNIESSKTLFRNGDAAQQDDCRDFLQSIGELEHSTESDSGFTYERHHLSGAWKSPTESFVHPNFPTVTCESYHELYIAIQSGSTWTERTICRGPGGVDRGELIYDVGRESNSNESVTFTRLSGTYTNHVQSIPIGQPTTTSTSTIRSAECTFSGNFLSLMLITGTLRCVGESVNQSWERM